ncbi:restriction endonuclease subunit S [Campylobacter upsaliensis]|nr:restriction endonuclease subunit S [Campylobacter upsaliensis]
MMKALNDNAHPLESLLQQHCPNGVEFKPLYELTFWDKKFAAVDKAWQPKTLKFTHILAKDLQNLIVPNGDIKLLSTGKFDDYTDTKTAQNLINEGEVLAIPSGGEANLKYYKGKFVDSGNILATARDSTNSLKFIYYYLLTRQKDLDSSFRGGSIKHPEMKKILQIPIPLPPLEIQQKIVEILDAFTELQAELQAELEAELEARLKQYHYYRNKLLSFEELEKRANAIGGGLKLVSLGELGKISMCKRILKNQTKSSGDIPFYKIGTFGGVADSFIDSSIFNEFKEKFSYPQKGDILISASGTIGKAVIYQGENAYYQDSNIVWLKHDGTKLNNKFLFYCYQNTQWDKYVSKGGTITRLYNDNLRKVKIPLPPLEVQNDIVELLDKFDTLTNDLTSGIPAEIEARKKQYEYYRERLLSFIAKD